MKKVMAICLAMVIVVGMSINVLAAPGSFVSSPSGNPAPLLVRFTASDGQCTARLVITAYANRSELPAQLKALIEKAYSQIVSTNDLTELNAGLAGIAANNNINGEDLAVSDLFDLRAVGCDSHEGHHDFEITLDADTLDRFVALLHMNQDGEWELISDAEVVNNGDHLKFSVDSLSPFAIVVNTNTKGDTPQTGDTSMIHIYAIIMAVSAVAIIVITVKSKKQRA